MTYYLIIIISCPTQPHPPARSKSRITIPQVQKSMSCATSQQQKQSGEKSSMAPSHPPSPTAVQHCTWARCETAQSMPSSPQEDHPTKCSNFQTEHARQQATSTICITTSTNRQKKSTLSHPSPVTLSSAPQNLPQRDTSQCLTVKR